MSFMFLENCSFKKSELLFFLTGDARKYLFISRNGERFLMQVAFF